MKRLLIAVLVVTGLSLIPAAKPTNWCDGRTKPAACRTPIPTPVTPRPTATPAPTPVPAGVSLADYGGNWADAIAAAQTRGKLVNVPAGTWPAFRILTTYSGLTIRGAGPGASIVPRNASQPLCDCGFMHVTHASVTIEGLTLRGWPISSGLSDDIMINGVNTTGLVVRNVAIANAQGIGIQIENVTGALITDVTITNTLIRSNGYHGVALWLYKGASSNTIRRVTIDGAAYAGVALDAGTNTGTSFTVDDNVFTDITVRNVSKQRIDGNQGSGWLITGASRNTISNWTLTDVPIGAGLVFGFDQGGLPSNDNRFTNGTTARIASTDVVSFGGQLRNVLDGGTGSGCILGLSGNSVLNWPGLVPC